MSAIISALLFLGVVTTSLHETRLVMGTRLEITLCGPNATRVALEESFEIAQKLDETLSNYKSDSEIEKVNRLASKQGVSVSRDLAEFIALSKNLSEDTNGAFDITVGPLLALWEEADKTQRLPIDIALKEARAAVGYQHIDLTITADLTRHTVRFLRHGMSLETGGIGKGFAVDAIVRYLHSSGIECGLINFGHSSIFALGHPPHEESWKVLLQFPGHAPLGTVHLANQALSASDSLSRYFEVSGETYGRIIDPRSGLPVTRRRQAIIITERAAHAEALSKALILGEEHLPSFKEGAHRSEFLLIGGEGEKVSSPGFPMAPVILVANENTFK